MARGKAAAAEASHEQFLRLMSHEMRTPLNGVIGMLGLLSRTRLDGAQRAYANAARESAEHLLGLVNDLLDYARLEAGKLDFEHAPFDLENLVQGVAELLSPRAHDKGLEIVWTVAPDAPDVLGDEGRLRQVLFNLAGNAVKFTDAGGVRIAVERAGGEADRPRLRFVVDDTGPGVPACAREKIFEEFGHVDPSDATRFGGAGLGLAVVRKLARAMGGEAGVEDRPGGGARFWFTAAFDAAPGWKGRGAALKGVSVAVVSPDPMVRDAVAAQVRGSRGRIAAHDKAPVVLIDHAQAAADGVETLPAPLEGRAIVLLKPCERELIARYRARGFHGYLIKPLRRASLAERVLAALGRTAGPAPVQVVEDDRIAPLRNSGVRVLLAEDNPVGALLARTLLRREGCTVETAASGEEVLAAMARARYDLVLMDVRMPGMDGLAATRALRARGDQTAIVALTANAFVEDRKACLEAGMDDHLTKPLEPGALRAAIARWTNIDSRVKLAS